MIDASVGFRDLGQTSTPRPDRKRAAAVAFKGVSSSFHGREDGLEASSTATTPPPLVLTSFDRDEAKFWSKEFGLGKVGGNGMRRGNLRWLHRANYPIQSLSFSSTGVGASASASVSRFPPKLAAASGPRASLWSAIGSRGADNHDVRHVPTGDLAGAVAWRRDGRLVAVTTGSGDGRVLVHDVPTRTTLRTFLVGRRHDPSEREGNVNVNVKTAVRCAAWWTDGTALVTGGDDGMVRVWDLPTGDIRTTFEGVCVARHGDSVRSVLVVRRPSRSRTGTSTSTSTSPPSVWVVTGSYDHTIRTFLCREEADGKAEDVSVVRHGAPVEALVHWRHPHDENHNENDNNDNDNNDDNGNDHLYAISAGGPTVVLWDVVQGRELDRCTVHAKTVTALCTTPLLTSTSTSTSTMIPHRLLTGGLDGLIRILEVQIHTVVDTNGRVTHTTGRLIPLHGIKRPSPVTSLAMSDDGTILAMGGGDGTLSVRIRKPLKKSTPQNHHDDDDNDDDNNDDEHDLDTSRRRKRFVGGTYAHFWRGQDAAPDVDDHVVGTGSVRGGLSSSSSSSSLLPKVSHGSRHEVALRQFRYADALDEALATKNPTAVVATLEELGRRYHGLDAALADRDDAAVEPLLSFLVRYLGASAKAAGPASTSASRMATSSALLTAVARRLVSGSPGETGAGADGSDAGGTTTTTAIDIHRSPGPTVEALLQTLRVQVSREVEGRRSLLRLLGTVDAVLCREDLQILSPTKTKATTKTTTTPSIRTVNNKRTTKEHTIQDKDDLYMDNDNDNDDPDEGEEQSI